MKDTCSHCGQEVEHVCLWCGEPAVVFCDGWIGSETDADGLFSFNRPCYSCDAPLCNEHRKMVGILHGTRIVDTMDYCPVHAEDRVTTHNAAKNLAEADRHRREAWAIGNRYRMKRASTG